LPSNCSVTDANLISRVGDERHGQRDVAERRACNERFDLAAIIRLRLRRAEKYAG